MDLNQLIEALISLRQHTGGHPEVRAKGTGKVGFVRLERGHIELECAEATYEESDIEAANNGKDDAEAAQGIAETNARFWQNECRNLALMVRAGLERKRTPEEVIQTLEILEAKL